jgi:hypothetical protein
MKYMKPVFNLSVMILLAVGFFILGLDSIRPVWNAGLANQITLVVILTSLTLWLVGWVVFDALESQEIDSQLNSLVTPGLRIGAFLIGIIIALAFSLMVSVVGNIALFVPLMALVVLAASIGDHLAIRTIIRKLKDRAPDADPKLVHYYTERPHMLLHCLQLFFMALAAAAYLFIIRTQGPGSEWIVYVILSVSILLTESLIWRWRLVRLRS